MKEPRIPYVLGMDLSLRYTGWVVAKVNQLDGYNPFQVKGYGIIDTTRVMRKMKREHELSGSSLPIAGFGSKRLVYIENEIRKILMRWPIEMAFIEGYSYNQKFGLFFNLGELGGIVKLLFTRKGILWEDYPPKSVKKIFAGSGNAGKDEMVVRASKMAGIRFTKVKPKQKQHVSDAFGCLYCGSLRWVFGKDKYRLEGD